MLKRGLLGYLPVNIVQGVVGVGAVTAFTRLLSPADYGAYALGFSVMSIVHTGLFTWLEASVARFHAAEGDDASRANLFVTVRRAYLTLVVAVPAVAALVIFVLPLSGPTRAAVGAGVGSIVTRSLLKLIQERRRAAGEVAGYARLDMLQTGGGFLLGMALATLGFGAAAPLIGGGVAAALGLALAFPKEARRMMGGHFERERLGAYAAYGLPLSLSLIMTLILATTDRFVLAGYLNEASVGAYHAGYTLASRTLEVFFVWLSMAGAPAGFAAMEQGPAALKKMALAQAGLIILIAFPAATGVALTAGPLNALMVGPALRDGSAQVTPWIALSSIIAGVTTYYFNTAFTLSRRTQRLLVAIAIPAVANVGIALVLIPRFGLDGAAWSIVLSQCVGLAASLALGRSVMSLPIPWMDAGKGLLACGLMAVVVLRLPALGGVAELALKGGVGALVYGAAALALDVAGARSQLKVALSAGRARLQARHA